MKKKAYIQPQIMIVIVKQSVSLLTGSDYKVRVSWDEGDEIQKDDEID